MPADSNYLAHFAKGEGAYDNLVSIPRDRMICAGNLPRTNRPAVCFTECPWFSLLHHAQNYSPYGIGFGKHCVFADGVYRFGTPFWLSYRPTYLRTEQYLGGKNIDFAHEREWRVAHDFHRDLARLSFVILNTYEDMARFPRAVKDAIEREEFILMDVYGKIEELWPTHVMERDEG